METKPNNEELNSLIASLRNQVQGLQIENHVYEQRLNTLNKDCHNLTVGMLLERQKVAELNNVLVDVQNRAKTVPVAKKRKRASRQLKKVEQSPKTEDVKDETAKDEAA